MSGRMRQRVSPATVEQAEHRPDPDAAGGSSSAGKPAGKRAWTGTADSEAAPPTERSMPAPPHRMTSALAEADQRQQRRELQHRRDGRARRAGPEDSRPRTRRGPEPAKERQGAGCAAWHQRRPHQFRLPVARPNRARQAAPAPPRSRGRRAARPPVTTGCQSEGTPESSSPF